jgi:hypothetical protein
MVYVWASMRFMGDFWFLEKKRSMTDGRLSSVGEIGGKVWFEK